MAKKGKFGDALLELPWIVRLIIVVFFDFVYGLARFIDGILEGDIVKILLGFLWILYGLIIGWIADIIWTLMDKRPLFF